MPNTRSIYRRHRKRPSRAIDGVDPVAEQYEGGREAPFSPRTPETSSPDSPAVVEAERRAEAGNVSKLRGKGQRRLSASRAATNPKGPRDVH